MARWPKAYKWGRKMYLWKYSLLNHITGWCTCSGLPRGCVNRIRLWSLRRDDDSGVLIDLGWTRRSDWPACVLAIDATMRIDRYPVREERSIARAQGQVVASCYTFPHFNKHPLNCTHNPLTNLIRSLKVQIWGRPVINSAQQMTSFSDIFLFFVHFFL